jgi:UDP-2,3-diacylglucosamine pyrophosphatase LpxH
VSDVTPVPLDEAYLEEISGGLDRAAQHAAEQAFDPATERIVIFSDHHRGTGDAADDFRRCEHAYTTALGYYLEEGYRLLLLGDVEELWEERAQPVIDRYRAVLELEAEFATRGGLERFYGNHDDDWRNAGPVKQHLWPVLGQIEVREALRLTIQREGRQSGTLLFLHGHQGTADSDRWGWASRLFVRYVWRPLQRRTGFSATSPASNYDLRAKHDRAMYEWARTQEPGLVLVAGHTHRPVFGRGTPDPPPTRSISELEELLAGATSVSDAEAAARLRAELEYARTSARRPDAVLTVSPPCYFNTGCCSFPDGDITGIEIADGTIRLVRWPANLHEIVDGVGGVQEEKRILEEAALEDILTAVTDDPAITPSVVEHQIGAPE